MKTWALELDRDQTIALARAIQTQLEHCQLGIGEDYPTTLANLLQIIRKFPSDEEFQQLLPTIVETPEAAR